MLRWGQKAIIVKDETFHKLSIFWRKKEDTETKLNNACKITNPYKMYDFYVMNSYYK